MSDEPFDPNKTAHLIRTDAGARKVVDRIDAMRNEVADLTTEVVVLKASSVKWDRLIFILGSASLTIVGGAWRVTTSSADRSDRLQAEQLRVIREDMAELRKAAVYSQGSFAVTVEKRAPAVVAKEVQATLAMDAGARQAATADGGSK